MLILKELLWSNAFSYGANNKIKFNENTLTQLMGINGSGKTSISLILQEVLYGKNIKNIKKQDIANNKSGNKGYYIMLTFEKDDDNYIVELDRKSNLKFRLFKNEKDISSHTSLNTYKTLANIIGIADFKVFCQLIYQHSTDSLDFLTATDTNRKKFLISLLQLDKYIELHEVFKSEARNVQSDINVDLGIVNTIEAWISNNENMDFMKQNLLPVEPVDPDWYLKRAKYKNNIDNINSINRSIILNKSYIAQLNLLDSKYYMGSAPAKPNPGINELRAHIRVLEHQYSTHQQKINKLNKVEGECPECLQIVNMSEWQAMFDKECTARDMCKDGLAEFWDQIPGIENLEKEIKRYKAEKTEFERLNQLIDNSLKSETLDLAEEKSKLFDITTLINNAETLQKSNEKENLRISAHNSKIDVVKSQLKQMHKDLREKNIELIEKENLSDIINTYLADLTYFQIYFKLSGEKLNIEVVDDIGNITSISNLSSGERARVNIATILAIRNILSSLTSTKINLLFLDEVIGVIDAEGKEKLSEILLQENLNTFIVSHDWSHPLIPRINIVKEHHISRIENDR